MIRAALECAAGLALAMLVLQDVFATAIVPGRGRSGLMLSRRVAKIALPLWRRWAHGVGVNFAPVVLVVAFSLWIRCWSWRSR